MRFRGIISLQENNFYDKLKWDLKNNTRNMLDEIMQQQRKSFHGYIVNKNTKLFEKLL